jgi:transposase InsO family protein
VTEVKLPAVSGSSGHLVVERLPDPSEQPQWPGQVFEQAELSYQEAMDQYVCATRDRLLHIRQPKQPTIAEPPTRWRQESEGRAERHTILERRKQEDADWKALRTRHHIQVVAYRKLSQVRRKQQRVAWEVELNPWRAAKDARKALLEKRRQENEAWHQRNQALKAGSDPVSLNRVWIAILVVTDNCTRQCLGLPLFRTGSKLTCRELVEALRSILPAGLAYLISDQGVHFRAKLFAELAQETGFIHVPIYRHRPQSNGIAERFVQTLKAWLQDQIWQSPEGLDALLAQFQLEYNDRPHQGLPIPGLSPNEFARRIWLM